MVMLEDTNQIENSPFRWHDWLYRILQDSHQKAYEKKIGEDFSLHTHNSYNRSLHIHSSSHVDITTWFIFMYNAV